MQARSQLALSLAAGVVAFAVAFVLSEWQVATLAGWDTTAAIFIAIIFAGVRKKSSAATKELALQEDDSRAAADAILIGASVFSLYVALTIGMTFQVSDTDLNSKAIRMNALRHSLLSYVFGVVVFATTINVIATLLTK